jgi:hypothetical protein
MSIEHPPIPTDHRLPAWRRGCLAYGEMRQAGATDQEALINKVETNLTRGLFLPARTQLGYPTRNKKKRLNHLPLDIHTGAGSETRLIPIEDYPGMIVTLRFPLPTILFGLAPTEEPLTGGVAIATLTSFGENLSKHPGR